MEAGQEVVGEENAVRVGTKRDERDKVVRLDRRAEGD
jgi:hypothetical protein